MLQLRVNELEKRVAELEYKVSCQQEDMQKVYNNFTTFTQNCIDYFNSANQTMQIHTKMINDLTELDKIAIEKESNKKDTRASGSFILTLLLAGALAFIAGYHAF